MTWRKISTGLPVKLKNIECKYCKQCFVGPASALFCPKEECQRARNRHQQELRKKSKMRAERRRMREVAR